MLLGLDTSRWSDNPATAKTIDWQKAKAAGVKFVIMKASEGGNWTDPVFKLHSEALKGLLPRGSYHYYRPNVDAKLQAAHYYRVAGNLELPPCLDLEDYYSELPRGVDLQRKVIEVMEAIDQAFGQECMLYTSLNIIKYYLALPVNSPILKRRLWIAQYGPKTPDITPFKHWTFWQYSESLPAAQYGLNEAPTVDANWYNGDQAQFDAEFMGVTPPVEIPDTVKVEWIAEAGALVAKLLQAKVTVNGVAHICDIDQRPPVVIPPPVTPPASLPAMYRILDDNHAILEADGGPRPYNRGAKQYPCTIRIEGGKSAFMVPPVWVEYLRGLMSKSAFNYIFKPASGWQNSTEQFKVESLTFGGNTVKVLRIDGNRAYIDCLRTTDKPGAASAEYVKSFSIQYPTYLDMSADGRMAKVLLMVDKDNLNPWIDVRELERV